MGKPLKLGTVYTASAEIKFIDDSAEQPVWKTLAKCMDTPAAIGKAVARVKKEHPGKYLWVFGQASGKKNIGK